MASWNKSSSRYKSFLVNNLNIYRKRSDVKAYLELLLSLGAIIIFSVFALRPTLITIAKLSKEIQAREETTVIMNEKITNLRKAEALYNKEEANINLLNNSLPDSPLPDVFIRQLEGLTDKNETIPKSVSIGVPIILLQPNSVPTDTKSSIQGIGEYNFTLTSISSYKKLTELLFDLQNIRRPVKINSINIQPAQVNGEYLRQISVSGSVPFVPDGTKIVIK